MDELLFVKSLVRDVVLLHPPEIGGNFMDMLQHRLRASFEGKCSRHGYILPGSVAVHRVLSARVETVSLNGDAVYDVQYFARICNPSVGQVLAARVISMNKFGVLVHSGVQAPDGTFLPVIESIIVRNEPEQAPNEIDLDTLSAGDQLFVEILGKKFELDDEKISVIGRAVEAPGGARQRQQQQHHGARS